ncbi:MAG TPA: glutamate synthase subunit alpha, partial [Janibacter terrae]|nr:glutamate synthase subunit alpha [Janibacter terrae]
RLEGDANDYVGKGLSGGRVIVRPPQDARYVAEDNVIAGNVIGYGATSGQLFLRGIVGERFCVRNSGATAVVEGVGDHGCEYMTGGTVLVLGPTGRNFAAGMSGGNAFVLDLDESLVNRELVDVTPLRTGDREVVRELLTQHLEHTDSAVARRLLDEGEAGLDRFSLVLPRDYQRVLDVRADAEAEGLDVDGPEVWDRIMEASRG